MQNRQTSEEMAIALSQDRKALRAYMMEMKSCLKAEYRAQFKRPRFDFKQKRLIGDGFYLQWTTRPEPDEPESYENQQTNRGSVQLYVGERS